MDHMGWRSPSTAHRYVKSNQVLHPGGAADVLSSLKIDLTDVYKEFNNFPVLSQHSSGFSFFHGSDSFCFPAFYEVFFR